MNIASKYIIIMIIAVAGMTIFPAHAGAQGPVNPVSKGSWVLNFGIGPGVYDYDYGGVGFGPGFQLAFEKGMWRAGPGVFTLGGEFGFAAHHYSYYLDNGRGYRYTWFTTVYAVRSAYHYGWKVRGLDTYAGLALGFRALALNKVYYNDYLPTAAYNPGAIYPFGGIFLGVSYFFSRSVGINAEVGDNITWSQIGLVFKLH